MPTNSTLLISILTVIPCRFHINRRTLITIYNLLKSGLNKLKSPLNMARQSHADDPSPPASEPSIPISYPLKTLDQLNNRSYFHSFHYPFNKSSVPLRVNGSDLPDKPRILVCHDMQGGYVDDKWIQGGNNSGAYAIWHWYLIDVFVYFSHNLVTLPPPCWTNTAHRHGVKVLGTFITESDEGRATCNKLLATKESAQESAERLVELAVALGFDGWLLNMEVELDVGQIPNLKEFVSHLTQTMHSSLPGSLVIWYDSVTIDGNLDWQNQLNEKNKPFFDVCDGIFVNYFWEEDYPKLSADVAGNRKFDVYMGIDVFGRNTYGGGQWNTDVALEVIKKDDVSAAIFAPGWVYESKQPPDFQTAQNRWWALIEKSWRIVQNYPKALPFYSNFDQGHGYHISVDGEEVLATAWNNISAQGFQPFLVYSGDPSPNTIQVKMNFKEASYNGGGSIAFTGTLGSNGYFTTRLFQGELVMGDLPVHFTYSVKSQGNSLLGLSLDFVSAIQGKKKLLLASHGANRFSSELGELIIPIQHRKSEISTGWFIQENGIAMKGYTLTEIRVICYRPEPEAVSLRSEHSSADIDSETFSALLGDIRITTPGQTSVFPPSTFWTVEGKYIKWKESQGSMTVSLKISWKPKVESSYFFPKYNIYVKKLEEQVLGRRGGELEGTRGYVGAAYVEAFYISELVIPSGISSIKFIIQPCDDLGRRQKVEESPAFHLDVEENPNERGSYTGTGTQIGPHRANPTHTHLNKQVTRRISLYSDLRKSSGSKKPNASTTYLQSNQNIQQASPTPRLSSLKAKTLIDRRRKPLSEKQ